MTDLPPATTSISEAHPVTGPERVPPEPASNAYIWWILTAAVALALLVYFRRRKRIIVEPTAEEWAHRELDLIAQSNGDGQALGELLPFVIRGYVERRHRRSIEGKTTAEVASELRTWGEDEHSISGWCNLLDRCDLAKFARQQFTPAESAETVRRAQTLLSSTLPPDESSTTAKTGEFR